jgi:hypothetical protein
MHAIPRTSDHPTLVDSSAGERRSGLPVILERHPLPAPHRFGPVAGQLGGPRCIVRVREILLAVFTLIVFCLGITQASAGEPAPPVVCVSVVGPVDANGQGVTTPVEYGDCP